MNDFKYRKMNFRIKRPYFYEGTFPQYNIPYEIGCFSLDAKGKYCNDGHQMKYLSMPEKMSDLSMDLNEGFDNYIYNFDDWEFNYNLILKWILSHQDVIKKHFVNQFSSSPEIDFVLFRGPLIAASSTLYEKNEGWVMHATKLKSVIYLIRSKDEEEDDEEEQLMTKEQPMKEEHIMTEKEVMAQKQMRMGTYGFKFEQCMVSDKVGLKPDTSVPVNANEKYFAVFKGKFDKHRLLFCTEFDCVDPEHFTTCGCDPTSPLRYVELKTSRIITSAKQKRNFCRYKLLQWYLQSYFVGILRVICGFRDDEGIVRKLKTFNVRDMPQIAKGLWSPSACLNFTSQFLDYVKHCVTKDEIVYEFCREPGSNVITCEELDSEYRCLPKWYTSHSNII